jgi:asparagine synthase (glutamine-hydrolysing)
LPAATYGIYQNGRLTIKPYWQPPASIDYSRSEADWIDELDATLDSAVNLRLVSDVPLGVFLSGGIDSSLIVADMVQQAKGVVKTFCIGFTNPSYDETAYADTVAKRFATEHHSRKVEFENVKLLPELVTHFDEPFADASFLPTWYLCRSTKERVTVALSGDGGDELFGGYRRYLAGKLSEFYLNIPEGIRRVLVDSLVNRMPAPAGYYGKSLFKKAKLFVAAANQIHAQPLSVAPQVFTNDEISKLFPGLTLPAPELDPLMISATNLFKDYGRLDTMLRTDFMTYLPDDILVKVDRMSMYHALEVRCPFLDHRVIELAYRMPTKLKIKGFNSKYVLRQLARRKLPFSIVSRAKQGFMIPLDIWFRRELKDYMLEMLKDNQAAWSKSQALRLFQDHLSGRHDQAIKLWSLAVLGSWAKAKV